MKTISAAEYQKKYGNSVTQQLGTSNPSYLERVKSSILSDVDQRYQRIQGIQERDASDFTKGFQTFGQAAGFAGNAIESVIAEIPGVKKILAPLGKGIDWAIEPSKPTIEKAGKVYGQLKPEYKDTVEAAGNLIRLGTDIQLVGSGGIKAVKGARAGAGATKRLFTATREAAQETATGLAKEIAPALGQGGDYLAGRVPKLLGIFSGENDDVIRQALKNPKVANTGIVNGDEALRAAVREGATGSVKIKNAFVKAYSEAKRGILGEYGKVVVPKNDVKGIFNNLLKKNGVKVTSEGLDFSTSKIAANPGEVGKIKTAWEGLDNWDQFTLGNIDDYKQFVGRLRNFATEAGVPSKSPFLGELYREIDNIIATNQKIPKELRLAYKELNKNFSNEIELYDDVISAFNSGDPFTRLAGALGKNRDTLRRTLEFYEQKTGQSVLPIVAGRELGLEKTAAFGFLNPRSWIDFFISPQVQGKAITTIGTKLQENYPKISRQLTQ